MIVIAKQFVVIVIRRRNHHSSSQSNSSSQSINDIPEGLNSPCRLFADDTISYLTVKSNADARQLQDDLHALASWEQKWSMEFHPDKCKVLSISRSKNPIKFDYTLHGYKLEHVTSAKYLGVTFNNKLTWDDHISNITNNA